MEPAPTGAHDEPERDMDYALFMVAALENDELAHEAPAIVGCRTPAALAAGAGGMRL
jgi:hypothetical protein